LHGLLIAKISALSDKRLYVALHPFVLHRKPLPKSQTSQRDKYTGA
jgi:hypothetical protein